MEKQKLRFLYRLSEKQFQRTFQRAKRLTGPTGDNFLVLLEKRLENVVYRGGLAKTRAQARQIVAHGHITVNGRKSKTPALIVRPGDVIGIRPESLQRPYFTDLKNSGSLATQLGLSWMETDADKFTVTILDNPTREDGEQLADLQAIIEFYSR